MTEVGKRIKLRRQELGLTVEELAKIIGMSRATLYRYENGSIDNVNVHKLQPIAQALLTTPAYLMGWSDEILNQEKTSVQKLIEFAQTVPEDKAAQMLRLMKAILASETE